MPQLSELKLTGLFDALRDELPDELQKLVAVGQELLQPVGSGEYFALQAASRQLEVAGGEIQIFKQPFSVSGKLAADLLVHNPAAEVPILTFLEPQSQQPIFQQAEILKAPDGQVLVELRFEAGAGIKGKLTAPVSGGLTLSANAAAGGGLVYRHLRPSPTADAGGADVTRLAALGRLLSSSRPPALVPLQLDQIARGEIHVLEARVNFDFGLDLTFGGNVQLEKDLQDLQALSAVFQGMPAELKVGANYSLQASFGYSLYQDMQLAVGRFNLLQDDWLRMRIQRLRQSELTLGAKLDLQVEYDLAQQSFLALYDRVLDLDPTQGFMKALKEVQALRGEGGWDAVRDKLVATVGTEVDELVGSADWRQWTSAQDQTKIDSLLGNLQQILEAYDELPDKIRSLWDTLLSKANLGPDSKILAALRQVEAIDPRNPTPVLENLLSGEWKQALSLLETLTGLSLDELLVDQVPSVSAALVEAQKLAAAAVKFVDDAGGLPAKAIDLIQSFADRTGIAPAVAWLQANATSLNSLVTALETKASEQIQQLVSRLVGKAWNAIGEDDFQKLGSFLDRMETLLDDKAMWEQKIRGYLNRLEGELGFKFSLEMSRLSERSALVDLELDPAKDAVVEAVHAALELGQARALVAELPEGETFEEAGYRLREAVFSSRRVRTSAMAVFFSLFGLQRNRQTTRVDEETIRVSQEGGRLVRRGSYQGGAVRTLTDDGKKTMARRRELGTWLSMRATGSGGDVEAPYDRGLQEQGLRLTFSRQDDDTRPGEVAALQTLLADLGFPVQPAELAPLSGMPITDLTLSLRLGQGAIAAFLSAVDEAGWNTDCLNAGHRWFDEGLIRHQEIRKRRAGQVLAAVLATTDFQQHWLTASDFLDNFGTAQGNVRSAKVSVDGQTIRVPAIRRPSPGRVQILLPGMFEMVESRRRPLDKLVSAQEIHAGLDLSNPDPRPLRQLAARFSTVMAKTAFLGKAEPNIFPEQWSNALFNLWLVFARVARVDPEALAGARGLATLRSKASAADDWQEPPLRWQLTDGLPSTGVSRLFPIPLQAVVGEAFGVLGAGAPEAVASKSSQIFHTSLDCPSARRIKEANRVFGAAARDGRTAHDDCR